MSDRKRLLKNLYNEAFYVVEKAQSADDKENFKIAKSLYIESIELFFKALELEPNKKKKKLIKSEVTEFMNRLEEIDTYIQELDEYHRGKLDG